MRLSALPCRSLARRRARLLYAIGKALVLSIIFFLTISALIAEPILAAGYSSNDPSVHSDVPENSYAKTQISIIEITSALICQLAGVDIINPAKGCLGIDPTTNKIGYAPQSTLEQTATGGLLGFNTQMMTALYTQPASGVEYMAQTADNFGIVKTARAQEGDAPTNISGFEQIEPLQNIWETVRNMTYIFFVLIFVLIGIGIMLRFKIDPRAVMTIQNQLPKVIIGILMITFSYSIVGFLIDTMWLATYVGVNTVSAASGEARVETCGADTNLTVREKAYMSLLNTPLVFANDIFKMKLVDSRESELVVKGKISDLPIDTKVQGGDCIDSGMLLLSGSIGKAIGSLVSELVQAVIPHAQGDCLNFGTLGIGAQFNPSTCISIALGNTLGFFAFIFGVLLALMAIIIAMFRVWWVLVKAYAYIIIFTIIGPFYILFGLIPGSSYSFMNWVRSLLGKLLAFPVAAMLIILAKTLLDVYSQTPINPNELFIPPLLGNPNAAAFGPLLAFAVLMIVPEVVNLTDTAMKAPQGKIGAAVTSGFKRGAVAGAPVGFVAGRVTKVGANHAPVGSVAVGLARWARGEHLRQPDAAAGSVTKFDAANKERGVAIRKGIGKIGTLALGANEKGGH